MFLVPSEVELIWYNQFLQGFQIPEKTRLHVHKEFWKTTQNALQQLIQGKGTLFPPISRLLSVAPPSETLPGMT